MTGAICYTADLKKAALEERTQRHDLIVILKRIYDINESRSMPSLAALYISSNNHHSQLTNFPYRNSQTPPGGKRSSSHSISATVTSNNTH